jgi:hypothetical protein
MPYSSNKALYANADGELCAADDPDVLEMVVAAGGTISDKRAAAFGLKGEGDKRADDGTFHDNTVTPRELKSLQETARRSAEARDADAEAQKRLLAAKPAGAKAEAAKK